MAMSAKYRRYLHDLETHYKRLTKAGDPHPTYSGYQPWEDGYKAGYAAGKAKGIKETEDRFYD